MTPAVQQKLLELHPQARLSPLPPTASLPRCRVQCEASQVSVSPQRLRRALRDSERSICGLASPLLLRLPLRAFWMPSQYCATAVSQAHYPSHSPTCSFPRAFSPSKRRTTALGPQPSTKCGAGWSLRWP